MTIWMMTASKNKGITIGLFLKLFKLFDVHKWVIGEETGKEGYKHLQVRFRVADSNDDMIWQFAQTYRIHAEKGCADEWEYEKKEGRYWTSEDNYEIRKIRFGKPRPIHNEILKQADETTDREILVVLDPYGNMGKSWIAIHLWERRQALVVPRASCTAEKLSAFICSSYAGEKYVIIDIPRATKITEAFYETAEEVKDGLVFDHRYQGHTRNIRGAKVIIFTNKPLNLKKLSYDRWKMFERGAP